MISIDKEILVPFHDVDQMGVVWHGRYVKYLEVARHELMGSINYSCQEMFESGYAWPVVDMRIKYVKPLRYDQKIIITAELIEWEYRLKINYIIRNESANECFTKAHTTQVAIEMATEEMCFESPLILKEKLGIPS